MFERKRCAHFVVFYLFIFLFLETKSIIKTNVIVELNTEEIHLQSNFRYYSLAVFLYWHYMFRPKWSSSSVQVAVI
jgi:hypothetical protein